MRVQEDEKKGKVSKIKFFKTCKDAVRTIPALIHDARIVEDLDTTGEDHAADAIRYGLQYIKNEVASLASTSDLNKKAVSKQKKKVALIKKRF